MKSLQEFINETMIQESRSILDQPEWGEISDIKYISKAADQMERIGSMDLRHIVSGSVDSTPKLFNIYSAMMHCLQDMIDNCLDNNELPESAYEEFAIFSDYEKFKNSNCYDKVVDNFEEDFDDDADTYIKLICKKWDDVCKKATGNYWN